MPGRARSAASDMSNEDMDAHAEKEADYQALTRQYRIMENDRKAYVQESQDMIKKQRNEIEKLENEREELLKDLRLIESRSNQTKNDKNTEDLSELGRTKLDVQQEIEDERKKHEELKAEIREWQKKNKEENKKMGGAQTRSQHSQKVARDSRKLENSLQLANNRFCDYLESNKKLREEIDSLRVERQRFDNLYKKLDKELNKLKQEIGEIIDQSTQAYDQRDEAQSKMILLKEKSDRDIQQHNAEMKELVRVIDHDKKLREFMACKGKERDEDPQMVEWRRKKEEAEERRKKESQTDTVDSYDAAFQRIKEITGKEDMDEIVEKFVEVEDRNFALFNYVNEQNDDIERLQEQIQGIKEDIATFKEQGIELERQRQHILKSLEGKQTDSSRHADDFDEKHKGVMKILDQLREGIDSLFNKINCDRNAINDMLGSNEGVTDENMLQYLGVVEERTNQLLLMQSFETSHKDYEEFVNNPPNLIGEGPQPPPAGPTIMPPAVGGELDSEGEDETDDERPLTRGELQNRALRSVKKRESIARKEGFRYDLTDAKNKSKKTDKRK